MRSGALDEAISVCTRALELSPGSPLRYGSMNQLAAAHNALGRYEEAVGFAKRAIALEPGFVTAHLALAIAYAQLGRIEEARQEVAIVVRLQPDATIATSMADRMRFPEQGARWAEGLRKAGMPE